MKHVCLGLDIGINAKHERNNYKIALLKFIFYHYFSGLMHYNESNLLIA